LPFALSWSKGAIEDLFQLSSGVLVEGADADIPDALTFHE
jgi:hypothetical protein